MPVSATEIIGQIFGWIATILTFISYQMKTPKRLLIVQSASTAAIMISYFFLGATEGMLLNAVCILRNIVYYFRKVKFFSYRFWPYLLAAAMVALAAISWKGPITLLIMIPLVSNTICLSLGNNQILRASILITCTLIILYNIYFSVWGGVVNESVAIVSSAIGLIRYRKPKKQDSDEKISSV